MHRKAEARKEQELRAWLAIKKRHRGLTLGTVVRVSGRLLTLMAYEFRDQPGNLRQVSRDGFNSRIRIITAWWERGRRSVT